MKIVDESEDKKYFTIIPNYILNHSTLWDREVYIQMKRITGEDGTCWTSQKTLSKQCGISINRLKKSLKYLLEHNWIKQIGTKEVGTKGGIQEVNEYKVANLWKLNMDFYETKGVSPEDIPNAKGVSPLKPKGYHENTKGVSPEGYKEEPLKKNPFKEELPDWLNKEIWNNWLSYRKDQRKPLTAQSIKLQLKELEKDKKNHAEILEQSIRNGWIGLFSLKDKKVANNILKAKDNKYDKFN